MQIKIENGRGYIPGNLRVVPEESKGIGKIILDASFTPDGRERSVQYDLADPFGFLGDDAEIPGDVSAAVLDLDLHLDLATRREMRDHVLRVDDLDVVRGLDVACGHRTLALLLQIEQRVLPVVKLEHHALEVEQDIDDVFLDAFDRRVFMKYSRDLHFGRGKSGHRRKKDSAQRIAERMAIPALERLHHDFGMIRGNALDVDEARFQKSTGLHVRPSIRYVACAGYFECRVISNTTRPPGFR